MHIPNSDHMYDAPNVRMGGAYYLAFCWLNNRLFAGSLPTPMLVLTRDAKINAGHYAPDRWTNDDGEKLHEIAVNANLMGRRDPVYIFTVLIHELAHHWQWCFGKPTRNGYHNQEWIEKVKLIGLAPVGSGQCVDTKLAPGGDAERAIADMPDEAMFPWETTAMHQDGDDEGKPGPPSAPVSRSGKRSKYTCALCGLNAWAKGGVVIICGECNQPLVEQMDAPPEEIDFFVYQKGPRVWDCGECNQPLVEQMDAPPEEVG